MENFKIGEVIQVKDFEEDIWSEAVFIAYDKGHDYPFICASNNEANYQFHLCTFEANRWAYARHWQ